MGEIVLIESNDEPDSLLTLSHGATTLKLTYVPERNAVRWETETEYGFERIFRAHRSTGNISREAALPTYTAEPSSPPKAQHDIWTLSLGSTTPPPSTNCSSGWNNHGNGAAVGCVPSVA